MSSHPHPCAFPPSLIGRCRCCGSSFVRRNERPWVHGFCGESCEYAMYRPDPDYCPEPMDPRDRDRR